MIEIAAIVCGTIAFIWVFTVVVGGLLARRVAAATPPVPTLDEVFAQVKKVMADTNL